MPCGKLSSHLSRQYMLFSNHAMWLVYSTMMPLFNLNKVKLNNTFELHYMGIIKYI